MTSRERLLTVLKHKIPDRVPVSTYDMTGWHMVYEHIPQEDNTINQYLNEQIFGAYRSGWWNKEPSYMPLMEYIRNKADCLYMEGISASNAYLQRNTRYEQRVEGNSTYTRIIITTPKGDLTQEFRVDKCVYTAWEIEHLLKDDNDIKKYMSIPFEPLPVDISKITAADKFIGDNGIVLVDIGDPICEVFGLFDFGEFTIRAMTDEKTIIRMLDMVSERQMFILEQALKQGAGPLFRFAGPESCTPPFLPNEFFKKFVTNYDKKLVKLIHDYGQYARAHSHGKIKTVANEFLEMEIDALDPVEAPISGDIELWEAKKIFGDKVCLFGNIQLKDLETLPPDQMREVLKKCVEEGKPDGNFVALPTATPINVPLSPITEENFRIFIDTVLEFGKY